jgi:8-oxo-dGTP pyrophosphatase MutT (NUDIX family)
MVLSVNMSIVAKHKVENCIWAPMPSKRYIKKLRENMNGYVNQESKKKKTVVTWIVNEEVTHILINLNLETYCLPDIYGRGGKWGLPKGKAESVDKDLKAAAIREVFEETGYRLDYDYVSSLSINSRGEKKNFICVLKSECMKNLTRDFVEYGKEILAIAWVPINDIGTVIPIENCNSSLKSLAKYNKSIHAKLTEFIGKHKLEAITI